MEKIQLANNCEIIIDQSKLIINIDYHNIALRSKGSKIYWIILGLILELFLLIPFIILMIYLVLYILLIITLLLTIFITYIYLKSVSILKLNRGMHSHFQLSFICIYLPGTIIFAAILPPLGLQLLYILFFIGIIYFINLLIILFIYNFIVRNLKMSCQVDRGNRDVIFFKTKIEKIQEDYSKFFSFNISQIEEITIKKTNRPNTSVGSSLWDYNACFKIINEKEKIQIIKLYRTADNRHAEYLRDLIYFFLGLNSIKPTPPPKMEYRYVVK